MFQSVHNLRKRFWVRIICSVLFCGCFIALGQAAPAQAASYYFKFSAPAIPPSSCNNTHNTIQGPFSLNVLAGMKYSMVLTLNGVNYPPATGTYGAPSSGSGFTYVWGLGYASISYPYPVRWAFTLKAGNGTPLTESIITFKCVAPGALANIVVTNITFGAGGLSGFVCPMFWDGRLNDCDSGQTVAVYCLTDGSVNILAIYKSVGYDAILASPSEIAAVPKHPAVNTPIKSGNGATLYRLTSGELQVNRAEDGTGKMYRFIFNDCPKS